MRWAALALLAVAAGCASVPRTPTREDPAPGCVITCPEGFLIERQHLCRGGKRWFADVRIFGENVVRGVDGTVLLDNYETSEGDYPKVDVERGTCSTVIQMIVLAREPSQRGVHPGEEDPGHPGQTVPP